MQICGDELVYQEECDLGSGVDFDGCTDECMVEVGFACRVDSNTAKSICSYTGELEVELLTIEKEMFSNTLKLAFSVDPQLQFFNTLDPNLYLNFDDPDFLSPAFSFSQADGILSVSFAYNQNIYGRKFHLLLTADESVDKRFEAMDSKQWEFTIASQSPLLMAYYSDGQYTLDRAIYFLSIIVVGCGYLIWVLGFFSLNRLAGL